MALNMFVFPALLGPTRMVMSDGLKSMSLTDRQFLMTTRFIFIPHLFLFYVHSTCLDDHPRRGEKG